MVGQTISHYSVLAKLGEGGMGVVYRALDTRLQRTVALKFLPPHVLDDATSRARFLREARAAAALNHANLCTVHEIDEERGFLAMEYLDGRTLQQRTAEGPLPLNEVIRAAVQIAAGLEAAHAKGIVHRDLKCANVMTTGQGQVKIMDFGLAQWAGSTRLTREGSSPGTPAYMAPEQFRGEAVDRRADLWALGVVIHQMTAGRLPFDGASEAAVMYAVLETKPEPLSGLRTGVPLALDRVVLKLLAKNPANRYQHAADAAVDLSALLEASKPKRRRIERAYLPALAGLAGFLAAVVYSLFTEDPPPPPPPPSAYQQITAFNDSATQPALSPDGRMLTFLRGPGTFVSPGQVYVKMLPSGEPVALTGDALPKMSPVFSPDSSRIAYTVATHGLGQWDTWTVPTLGGRASLWLGNASGLVWSRPGRLLFSEIKHGIHMAIVTSGEAREDQHDLYLPPDMRGMMHRSALSPDGNWLLGAEMDRNGWIPCRIVRVGDPKNQRTVGPAPGACTHAEWSPDGEWMYFTSDAGGNSQVWRQRFPDGKAEQLTSGPAEAEGIAVAPDGRSLITAIGIQQQSVWVHRNGADSQVSQEGDAILPFFGDGRPGSVFLPDGSKLFYLVHRGPKRSFGGGEIWVADLPSGASQRFLAGVHAASYDVSADGKLMIYSVVDSSRRSQLWLSRTDGREPPRRLSPQEAMGPAFGRHNNVFYRGPDGPLDFVFETDLTTGKIRKAIPEPVIDAPSVSADGEWLVVRVSTRDPERPSRVVAYPRAGGQPVGLCDECSVRWTRDGRYLFFAFGPGQALAALKTYVIALPPGRSLPDLPPQGIRNPADVEKLSVSASIAGVAAAFPGPDRSLYAFTRTTVHRNLYRIPLR